MSRAFQGESGRIKADQVKADQDQDQGREPWSGAMAPLKSEPEAGIGNRPICRQRGTSGLQNARKGADSKFLTVRNLTRPTRGTGSATHFPVRSNRIADGRVTARQEPRPTVRARLLLSPIFGPHSLPCSFRFESVTSGRARLLPSPIFGPFVFRVLSVW
jgi:hypothetical protein